MHRRRYRKLTVLRKKNNLTIPDMAEKLNISTAYYSQIETKKKRLSYDMALKIGKIFNLKPDELFFEDEVNFKKEKEQYINEL